MAAPLEPVGAGEAWGPSFSADGSLVAAAWSEDDGGQVRVLDLSTDRVVSTIRVPGAIDTALSPDGIRWPWLDLARAMKWAPCST